MNLSVSLVPRTEQPEMVGPVYGFLGAAAAWVALWPGGGYAIAIAAIAARCPTGFFSRGWIAAGVSQGCQLTQRWQS